MAVICDTLTKLAIFFIPLKLSLTYVFLLPAIALFLIAKRQEMLNIINEFHPNILIPFYSFLLLFGISSIFGYAPITSEIKLIRMFYVSLAMPLVFDLCDRYGLKRICLILTAGQSVSALHSVIEGVLPEGLKNVFIGAVSESGQLTMSLFIAWWLFEERVEKAKSARIINMLAFLAVPFLLSISFAGELYLKMAALFIAAVLMSMAVYNLTRENGRITCSDLLSVVTFPLLFSALLINLKRGPIFGVCFAVLVGAWYLRKRALLSVFTIGVLAILLFYPLRERFILSSEHFFIAGGRSVMWNIAIDIARKHPLGIGFDNAKLMQMFDESLPPSHTHFHNNVLNVLVEGGWITAMAYLWWIVGLLALCFKNREAVFVLFAGLGILAWQLAGLVEYNLGDTEVILVAYVLIALIARQTDRKHCAKP